MRWISEEISWLSIVGTNSINMVWKLHVITQLGQSLAQKLDYARNRVHNNKSVQLPYMVSTTTVFAVWHGKQCGQHVHRLCKLCSNHNAAIYYFTTDCRHHTAEMVVVDTIWQLHTIIVLNSWCYELLILWIICVGWELYKTFTAEDTTLAQKAVWNNQQTTL